MADNEDTKGSEKLRSRACNDQQDGRMCGAYARHTGVAVSCGWQCSKCMAGGVQNMVSRCVMGAEVDHSLRRLLLDIGSLPALPTMQAR